MTSKEMSTVLAQANMTADKAQKGQMFGELLKAADISPNEVMDFESARKALENAIRLRCAEEKGIKVGVTVAYGHAHRGEVSSVTGQGVRIKGIRGVFHPIGLDIIGGEHDQP